MSKVSKTARASMKQGQVVETDPFNTNEKKIAELRKLRDPSLGKLFVNRMDFIDALLEEYDKVIKERDKFAAGAINMPVG